MSDYKDIPVIAEDIAHMGIYKVTINDPLDKVIKIMDEKGISGVMVEDPGDKKNFYIISHSDIIRFINTEQQYIEELIKMNLNPMIETKAKDIMRGPIEVIPPNMSIDEVIQRMHLHGSKRIFVGDENGYPVGIITLHDILVWTSSFFRSGNPILIAVMENNSGLILAKKFFRELFSEELLELFGGSISAITSITSEVLKHSGNLRVIEKDYYVIMLEPDKYITAILVADYQSIDLRRKLKAFLSQFLNRYRKEIIIRQKNPGPINVFDISEMVDIFE